VPRADDDLAEHEVSRCQVDNAQNLLAHNLSEARVSGLCADGRTQIGGALVDGTGRQFMNGLRDYVS
jgi:hypothetical protein